jgi:hypothetical protein
VKAEHPIDISMGRVNVIWQGDAKNEITLYAVGGLLGHWAVWTRKAVDMLEEIKQNRVYPELSLEWLTLNVEVMDCNAAFFDPAHAFHGCIPSIHEVLILTMTSSLRLD